ncbi:uncharacterized protein KY384_005587 [Bacidia gigantensis]|uniref:uncharacterized protein n=1 Tax=Bacidia gigantensis TaxID=2732470 RepID=UPI001D05301B|nr:uncharacterized protein KY384_005587 [Bacidia gigantensis]KAG8530105.1 hypothetical protein KY384_005587 [Bacidia gigantensis]
MALEAYRSVIRAARTAFQGDARVYSAAIKELHSKFSSNRHLSPEDPETSEKVAEAREVARLLRENIVQGESHAGGKEFKLRFHSETERGDNASTKATDMGLGQAVHSARKVCSVRWQILKGTCASAQLYAQQGSYVSGHAPAGAEKGVHVEAVSVVVGAGVGKLGTKRARFMTVLHSSTNLCYGRSSGVDAKGAMVPPAKLTVHKQHVKVRPDNDREPDNSKIISGDHGEDGAQSDLSVAPTEG